MTPSSHRPVKAIGTCLQQQPLDVSSDDKDLRKVPTVMEQEKSALEVTSLLKVVSWMKKANFLVPSCSKP